MKINIFKECAIETKFFSTCIYTNYNNTNSQYTESDTLLIISKV